jgi:hypothetical protein
VRKLAQETLSEKQISDHIDGGLQLFLRHRGSSRVEDAEEQMSTRGVNFLHKWISNNLERVESADIISG